MAGDIKQRIVLEGENEYKRALQDANRNLKTLRSELKAESAELGRNATEQQKNAVKAKNLQQQIREQEKAVKAHRDALEEVREKYGDNEEAIAKYEQRLNEARATLANLKNQLDSVGNSYESVSSGAKKSVLENDALARSFERISDVADGVSKAMEGIFKGVVGTIKDAVGVIWGELSAVAAKADDYMDLAAYFGSSATEVQKWSSAMKAARGDLSTVTQLITKLKYNEQGKTGVTNWFHISAENYTNDLEYFQAVMQSMVDSREEMMKAGTWDKAMADIFGNRKGFDVEGILSDWDDIVKNLHEFNVEEGGYGLTEDEIEKMATLANEAERLKTSWQELKSMAVVHLFGDLALNITGNLQNILDGFRDYFNAGDDQAKKDAAIQKIKDNIKEMFEAIRAAIEAGVRALNELATEFKNSDDPTSQAIGNVLQGIADTIAWLADPTNWEKIKEGILIVLGVWLTAKLVAVGSKLTGIIANLRLLSAYKTTGQLPPVTTTGTPPAQTTTPPVSTAPATAPTVAPSVLPTGLEAGAGYAVPTVFNPATGTLMSGGGALGATGSLSAVGVLGGTALLAGWVAGVSEIVNSANRKAHKAREMSMDAERIAENLEETKQDYSFSGINREAGAQSYIQGLMSQTGDQASASQYSQMRYLAELMGPDIMKLFEYTNTSGEKRNKLTDMLDMGDRYAAVAAMIMQAAGVTGYDLNPGLAAYRQFVQGNGLGTEAYTELTGYFNKSMQYDPTTGKMIIPGVTGNNEIMPVINGVPLANMSGYVMTAEQNKPKYSNGIMWYGRDDIENAWGQSGTWDPAMHMSDWWKEQGKTNQEISDMKDSIDKLPAEIGRNLSNIKIVMDKETVGYIVAPVVSQQIAREFQ